jgi:hypothetical protein
MSPQSSIIMVVTQPFSQTIAAAHLFKIRHDCQGFLQTSKAKTRSTRRRLRRSLLFGEFRQSQAQRMDALSSLSFNLNAITTGKRNDDARARTGRATRTNAFLVGRQSSKQSIETLPPL